MRILLYVVKPWPQNANVTRQFFSDISISWYRVTHDISLSSTVTQSANVPWGPKAEVSLPPLVFNSTNKQTLIIFKPCKQQGHQNKNKIKTHTPKKKKTTTKAPRLLALANRLTLASLQQWPLTVLCCTALSYTQLHKHIYIYTEFPLSI